MARLNLGIYGGTFSPPHLGHLRAAESFIKGAALDKLLIMPDFIPPHKTEFGNVTAEDRLEMCRIAFAELKGAEVSDFEILRGGKSYTYLTLESFASPDVELYFLCGTDMLLTLDTWKHSERIFELATICYVRRENDEEKAALIARKIKEYKEKFDARIIEIPHDTVVASSTELRAGLLSGSPCLSVLPSGVSEYISERGLYR